VTIHPQPLTDRISPSILALNNAHAAELSWLDAERLGSLVRQSFYARRIGEADAFLLAFDQRASYRPDTAWPGGRFPPHSSRSGGATPVLMSSEAFRCVDRGSLALVSLIHT
jgi:hypothetical protein